MVKVICIIPTLQSGGMERVMSLLANYFAEKKKCRTALGSLWEKPENILSVI